MSSANLEIRPATAEEIQAWGERPKATIRGALIVLKDGEPCAIAGYYIEQCRAVVCSEIRLPPEEARRHGRQWYRAAKALLRTVSAAGLPAVAIADEGWPNSGKFLERLGFTRFDSGVYVIWE